MNRREYHQRSAYGPTEKHHITLTAEQLSAALCAEDKSVTVADIPRSVCAPAREIFPLWIKIILIGRDAKLNRGEFRYCLQLQHFLEHQTTILVALIPATVVVIMVSLTWLIIMFQQAAHLQPARIVVRG